jgi:hypothetical protein
MLSSHAFNALLKLIEEPPDHVVFILATTDTHKVPATIISRTQRHDFRRLPEATIVGKLRRIVETEGVEADDDALALIARLADGGMRDAESLLDQVLAYADARLTEADVREAVGLADDAAIGPSSTPISPATPRPPSTPLRRWRMPDATWPRWRPRVRPRLAAVCSPPRPTLSPRASSPRSCARSPRRRAPVPARAARA